MVATMHRMHLPKVGEGVIHVPGGVPYKVDTLQQYPLGSYMRIGNKGFVYAKAGNTLSPNMGAKQPHDQKIDNVAIQADYDAGVTKITISSHTSCTEDELVGGEVIVFPAGGGTFTRGIIGNTDMSATDTLEIELDSPTPVAITTSGSAEVFLCPYMGVSREDGDESRMVMGMPTCVADVGEFLWLQVEGLSWVSAESEAGDTANSNEVCFGGDGALRRRDSECPGEQRAGVIIGPNKAGTGQGAPFVMLNIDH